MTMCPDPSFALHLLEDLQCLRQAFIPLVLTAEKMHAADSILAREIDAFYTEFKATVKTELQPQLNSGDKSAAE